jgi:hypothetical protein
LVAQPNQGKEEEDAAAEERAEEAADDVEAVEELEAEDKLVTHS